MTDPDAATSSRRLVGNTAALFAGRLGVALFGWAGSLIIVRSLSVHDFGQFTFIFGVLGLMSIVTDMGTGRVAIAGVADDQPDPARFAGAYVVLRCVLGVGGYLLALLIMSLGGYPSTVVTATAVGGIVVLLATPSNAIQLAFQVTADLRPVAIANVVAQVAQLALTAVIAASGNATLLWFMVPAILFEVVALAWKLRSLQGRLPFQLCIDLAVWGAILREAVPLAVGGALGTLYYRIDTVMLSKLDTFAGVGIYGVAYKLVDIAHFVSTALHQSVMYPLVRHWERDRPAFRATVQHSLVLLLTVASILVSGAALFSGDALGVLYGQEYEVAHTTAALIMAGELFVFITSLAYAALIAMGRRVVYAVAAGVGVAVNVGLNLWLIPALSYEGAALTTLVTNALVAAIMWTAFVRTEGLGPIGFGRGLLALPIAAGAGVAGLLTRQVAPWPIAAVVTVTAYAAGIHLARVPGPRGLRDLRGEA